MGQTGRITEFTREHIPRVADLWGRAYRKFEGPAPESLRRYFERIYFQNPWSDPELPSYVFEGVDGELGGFIGLFPRSMIFKGRPIRMRVLSTVMVDPRSRGRGIGLELMQTAAKGPQDLFYCDGANAASAALWKSAGGRTCLLYSCSWFRTLRPAAHFLGHIAARPGFRVPSRALSPLARLIDTIASRVPGSPFRLPAPSCTGGEASAEALLGCRFECAEPSSLYPSYGAESFRWLLEDCAEATRRGRLESVIVRDADGAALGWYIFFARSGGWSEVLQMGARPGARREVLLHLFDRARECGSLAIRGQMDPAFLAELCELRCEFSFDNRGVLVHSRDDSILAGIHAGDTALSRLDGEWWMHFADGPWAED